MTLVDQVNHRRIARGREPVTLMRLERILRYIAGQKPAPTRSACFQIKQRATGTDETRDGALRLRRVYVRAARGGAA